MTDNNQGRREGVHYWRKCPGGARSARGEAGIGLLPGVHEPGIDLSGNGLGAAGRRTPLTADADILSTIRTLMPEQAYEIHRVG
jgi:hypothetical protein